MRHAALLLGIVLAVASHALILPVEAETKNTCDLVASTDIEAALDEPVGKAHSETLGLGSTCRFLSTATPVKYISVMVQRVRDDLSSTKMTDLMKRLLATNAKPVNGLGDDAAWGSLKIGGKTIDQMMVRVGKSTTIMIMINGLPDNADTMSRVETLAAKIVPKV